MMALVPPGRCSRTFWNICRWAGPAVASCKYEDNKCLFQHRFSGRITPIARGRGRRFHEPPRNCGGNHEEKSGGEDIEPQGQAAPAEDPGLLLACEALDHQGFRWAIEAVGYEFQLGGNKMLRVLRGDG